MNSIRTVGPVYALAAVGLAVAATLAGCGGGSTTSSPSSSSSSATLTLQDRQAAGACDGLQRILGDTTDSGITRLGELDTAIGYAQQAASDPRYQQLASDFADFQSAVEQNIRATPPVDIFAAADASAVKSDCAAVPR